MDENVSFLKELSGRVTTPWNWSFSGYLLIAILFGGVGIFFTTYEVYKANWSHSYRIAESISVFFVAIIATSFIDLNLSQELRNRTTFLIYSFLSYGVTILLLWLTFEMKSSYAFMPAGLGLILATLTWIIANSDNKKLSEQNFFNEMRGDGVPHGESW